MEMQYHKWHSPALNRDMECKVYGRKRRPMLFVPCQDGRFFDFENFHMADTLAPWIDEGQLMVFSIDTIDRETWSNTNGNPRWRIERHEQWIRYIIDEMAPFMRSWPTSAMAGPDILALWSLAAAWVPCTRQIFISAFRMSLTVFWRSAEFTLRITASAAIWTTWSI